MNLLPLITTHRAAYFCLSISLTAGALTACSSAPADPKADLSTAVVTQAGTLLDEQANYVYAKNASRKLVAMNVEVINSAFTLAVEDVMSGLPSRIPEENYNELITNIRKNASPLASHTAIDLSKPDLPPGLREAEERVSYMTARPIAQHFIKNGIPIIKARMVQGLDDAKTHKDSFITPQQQQVAQQEINQKLRYAKTDWTANRNHYYERQEALFFAHNQKQPGVITLDSGVQYLVTHPGTGRLPALSDTVNVHYQGTLLDDMVFDSSYAQGRPALFPLRSLIPGFKEALQRLPEGTKATIYIPARHAYRDKGTPQIPPKAAIKFDIELINIHNTR